MTENLQKIQDESPVQYIFRVLSLKDSGTLDMTWEDVTELLNRELGENKESASYRKPWQGYLMFKEGEPQISDDATLAELREAKQELYKERQRLRDERTEYNKLLRSEARKEAFMEELASVMVADRPLEPLQCEVKDTDNETELVVCLADLHGGLTATNSQNVFDNEVLHERLQTYLTEISTIQARHKASICRLALLGDLISGSIHPSLAAQNCENTVNQIKTICTELRYFIESLSAMFDVIYVYSVSGNHSRINPKKDDNLPGDNLDSLVPFYLQAACGDNNRVKFLRTSYYGEYVTVFDSFGWQFVMVHGDLDSADRVVDNVTQIIGGIPDVILMGHRHSSELATKGKTRVVQSGCLCGTDNYAYNKRLFSPAEQTVLVTSDRKPIECIYNVQVGL